MLTCLTLQSNMNTRANIMSFIEQFCDMAVKEDHEPYVRMMQRDILRVVDAVVPPDGSGAANVKHVRLVLGNLQDKGILSAESVAEIDAALKDRDTHPEHYDNDEEGAQEESGRSKTGSPRNVKTQGTRLDKRQIEQRVEEDRERNKRLRESMWAVSGDTQEELQQNWDAVSDTNSDDIRDAAEEAMEQAQVAAEMRGEL
jgi:CTD kinase subunit gamma